MTVDPALLLGPLGLTIAAVAVVVALWRVHIESYRDLRTQRDAAYTRLDRLTEALEALLPLKVPR